MKLLCVLLLLAAVDSTPEIRYFRFQRPVQLPANTAGQTCLVPDEQAFAHAAPGLADLRLYRGSEQVPYVLRNASPRSTPRPAIKPLNLGRRGKQTVFDANMPEGEYRDVDLPVTGHDFLASVSVSGSQKATNAATHIGTYTIFDFTSQHLGRSTVLHLPASNFRVLHFVLSGPLLPGQIGDIFATPQPAAAPKYFTLQETAPFVQKGHESVAELTIPPHVPVDRILLDAPAQPANFSRPVHIAIGREIKNSTGENQLETPLTTAFGDILRVHRVFEGRPVDEEHLFLDTPEIFYDGPTHWTITIDNGDDAPIQFTPVRLQMLERDLCFEAAAAASTTLYYGDSALNAPRYDYALWSASHPDALTASLGPETPNSAYRQRPDERPFTEKHPELLWTVLIAVIALLGLIAFRSARRMQPPASMP